MRKKTHQEFVQEVYDLTKDEFTVLSQYKTAITPILMRHNKCNNEFTTTPNKFLTGSRCPICAGNIKKTTEQFKQEVFNLVGNEYEVLGKYINNHTKIEMKHNICKNIFSMVPSSFLNGCQCPFCSKNAFKGTEKFKSQVHDVFKDEYTILGEYTGINEKVLVKHNKCGNEFYIRADHLLNGSGCPKCAIEKLTKTHEQYCKEIYNLVGNKFTIISKYKNSHSKIKIRHNECGYEWETTADNFLYVQKCPVCDDFINKDTEIFKKQVYNLVGNEYEVLGEYKNANINILMKHNICGYEWNVKPGHFLFGTRCPKCNKGIRSSTEEFIQKVKALANDEYIVLGEYINNHTKIKMKHNTCNSEYYVCPSDFLSGRRCPICNEPKGERKIRHLLENNNINFLPQFTKPDCKDIKPLPFDFAIFEDKEKTILKSLIEYDGIGHYDIESFGKKSYYAIKKHDKMKDKYCKEYSISLLRIPYWKFDNIETILKTNNII